MLLGYNHNVTYKGSVFHIQTEDSGVKNPRIITLLYRDGVILCSKRTSYADILMIDCLETVVEDLMKEQHKEMLRRLKNGDFDQKAFVGTLKTAEDNTETGSAYSAKASASSQTQYSTSAVTDTPLPVKEPDQAAFQKAATYRNTATKEKRQDTDLDKTILNFFGIS